MVVSRGFKPFGASIIGGAVVLSIALLLLLVACGGSSEHEGESQMNTDVSSGCTGQDKLKADRVAIDSFNYGYNIGRGFPGDPNELSRIQRDHGQLTPACQQYVTSIGERLQRMLEARQIRERIDKLPW